MDRQLIKRYPGSHDAGHHLESSGWPQEFYSKGCRCDPSFDVNNFKRLVMKTTPATISLYREQCINEEIANSISHGAGFIAAATITPILIIAAIPRGTVAIVGASVFGATMMTLYLASTLYHACPRGRLKRIFQVIDHSAIFLLIAGTYTGENFVL